MELEVIQPSVIQLLVEDEKTLDSMKAMIEKNVISPEYYGLFDGDIMKAITIFTYTGTIFEALYWYVLPDYRNQGVSDEIHEEELKLVEANGCTEYRFISWPDQDSLWTSKGYGIRGDDQYFKATISDEILTWLT